MQMDRVIHHFAQRQKLPVRTIVPSASPRPLGVRPFACLVVSRCVVVADVVSRVLDGWIERKVMTATIDATNARQAEGREHLLGQDL